MLLSTVIQYLAPGGMDHHHHDPSGTDQHAAGTDHQAAGTDHHPAGTGHHPAGTNNQPAGTSNQPAGTSNHPAGTGHYSAETDHHAPSGQKQIKCNHDVKYVDLSHGFKKYQSCQNGYLKQMTCPRGSIFYFALQCCVPISKVSYEKIFQKIGSFLHAWHNQGHV